MADPRRIARRPFVGSLPRPIALGPRLLAKALLGGAERALRLRLRATGAAAVCATAAEPRPRPDRRGGTGSGAADRPRYRETLPDAARPLERAHEAVASHTTSPDDLASLLAMLDLRPGPHEKGVRPEDDGGDPGSGAP
ncbi:hypothetical protein SAVIM338S_00158 [Streptomyces avidinii]